jgi:hypothetical protein
VLDSNLSVRVGTAQHECLAALVATDVVPGLVPKSKGAHSRLECLRSMSGWDGAPRNRMVRLNDLS